MRKLIMALVLCFIAYDANAALTVSNLQRHKNNDQWIITGDIAFDSSYLTGGESLTASLIGLSQISDFEIKSPSGLYQFETSVASGAASATIKTSYRGLTAAVQSIVVTDDNTAATNGKVVVVESVDGVYGYLNAQITADGTGRLAASGSVYVVRDDTTTGSMDSILYFDEDAANVDERFLSNFKSKSDHYVNVGGGQCIKVKHSATASAAGVKVYFDENNAETAKLVFISPTNAAGAGQTDSVFSGVTALGEVPSATDLSALTGVQFQAVGK